MNRLTIVSLSLFLVAAGPQLTPEQVVKKCVKVVRDRKSYSGFDAYLTARGAIRYFGTEEEQFQFEKCLEEHGIPVDKDREGR